MKEDLITHLANAYEVDVSEAEAVSALTAAIEDFEKLTKISPFIYKGEETKEVVISTGRGNKAGADVVFLDNYVNDAVITVNDATLVDGTDYEIVDRSMIMFFCRRLIAGLKISITGKWGFAQTYPEDVKHALIDKATCILLKRHKPSLLLASRIEINTLRIEFNGVGNNLQKQLLDSYNGTVELYRFNQGFIG